MNVDGVAQTFNYDFGAAGNATTVDAFVTNFNGAQLGVTASFDHVRRSRSSSRATRTTPARAHRARRARTPTTPGFTITDSNAAAGGTQGTPSTSMLEILGACGDQRRQPERDQRVRRRRQRRAPTRCSSCSRRTSASRRCRRPRRPRSPAAGSVTVAPPAANPRAFAQLDVGQVLTIGAGTPAQENVVVTAVNRVTGSITFTAAQRARGELRHRDRRQHDARRVLRCAGRPARSRRADRDDRQRRPGDAGREHR